MSRRRLRGWEPKQETHFEYEGDRIVRAVTYKEPEWRPEDVALALAAERLDADLGAHGVPMSIATDPDNQFKFKAPQMPSMDWAAKARGDAQDAYYNGPGKDRPRHGHLWGPVELSTDTPSTS